MPALARSASSGSRTRRSRVAVTAPGGDRGDRAGPILGPVPPARPRDRAARRFAGLAPPTRWPRPRSAPRPDVLEAGVETLPRVGPAVRNRLAKLGLRTVGDLLYHRPRRYERPIDERSISDLFGADEAVIQGVVLATSSRRGRGRLKILSARVADDTGEIKATWFNQPWLEAQLTPGTKIRLRGKPNRYGFQVESYDLGEATETADYAPVYPASEALAQKQLRALVAAALEHVRADGDALPAPLAVSERLPLRADALVAMHHPRSPEEAEEGRRRLAFDELLVLQLALARRTAERERLVAEALPPAGELLDRYREVLPFTLTDAQEQAIAEIDRDLARTTPMQRLAPGRRRLRQDRRRARHAAAGRRGGTAGRADGADRGARRAALPHRRGNLHGARRARGAADERARREGARQRPPADRVGRRADRDRHARADPEGGRLPRPRRRRRRRAAPLRRRAALRARRGTQPARPPHDGDADPAHARAHRLRRPRPSPRSRRRPRTASRSSRGRCPTIAAPRPTSG